MKKNYTLLFTLLITSLGFGQTLSAGDLAIIGLGVDDEEALVVALEDISSGESVFFTDEEWGGSSFNSGEGFYEWVTPAITAGTVFTIDTSGTSEGGTVSHRAGSFALGNSGDGFYLYQTSTNVYNTGTYTVIGFAGEDSGDAGTLAGTGLVIGTNAIYYAGDNGIYVGARTGEDKAGYLSLIYGSTWTTSGTSQTFDLTDFAFATGCTAPSTQASAYNTTSITNTTATLNWTSGDGDEVLVVVKDGSAVDTDPSDGTAYTGNTVFTSGDQIGTGNYVVQSGSATSSVSITGLTAATTYHVAVYEYNTTGTCYELTELTGDFTTDCSTPTDVTAFTATSGDTTIDLTWTNESCFDDILVVAKATSVVTVSPTGDGSAYTANATFGSGTDLGTNEYAVYKGTGTSVTVTGLTNGTTYHFEAFARKTTTWSSGSTDSAIPNAIVEALAGDLIITEVSGDASGTGSDNGYMEIYNRSNKIINLDNIEARYYNTNPNSPSDTVTLSGSLSPGGYLIVTQNGANYTTEYSDTADATGTSFFFNGGDDGCDVYHTTNGVIDQFNDNGSGQSPWTWSDSFTYNRNSSDSGAVEANWTQDGTETPRTKPNLYFWTGNADDSWTNTGNWDEGSAPASTTDVVITDQTNEPSISTSVDVSNLTTESSSDLIVEKTGNLEVSGNINNNGSINLESDSNEYSSLILEGTVSGSGTLSYDRHVNINGSGTTGSNDLISAPFTGQAFNTFATANPNILSNTGNTLYLFGPFDKTTGEYLTYSNTETATLDPGVGYRAASDDNGNFTFTGTANTGTVSVDITNSGPTEVEWNLVGNPFPSYINVHDFLNHVVSTGVSNINLFDSGTAAIYGYDGSATNGWTIYNLANTTASTVIAPGQGFFVSADATNAPLYDLEFTSGSTTGMQTTGTSDDFIVGREAAGTLVFFTLQASTASDSFDTQVYFNANSDTGFNFGFDTAPFAYPPFRISTAVVDYDPGDPDELGIQSINNTDLANTTIPLGVWASQGEQITFTLTDNTTPVTTDIYLDDVVDATSTLLNTGDYVFTPSTALSGTGRFFIRVFDPTLSTIENTLETLSVYALNKTKEIIVKGQLKEDSILNLYDIQGREILSTQLDNTTINNRIDVSELSAGVYVVSIKNDGQIKSQKVIIK